MKIYEIISESKDQIDEDLKSSILGGIGRTLFGNKEELKSVANSLYRYVNKSGKLDISNPTVQAAINKYGKKIIKTTEKNAKDYNNTIGKALFTTNFNEIKTSISTGWSILKKLGWAVIIGQPFATYYDEIEQGIEQVEAGNWDDATFQVYRKKRTAILVATIGKQILYYMGIGASVKFATGVGNFLTFGLLSKIPGLTFLTKVATPAAQLYFMQSINTPEGANAIAQLLVQPILGSKYTISDLLGSLSVSAIDFLSKKADESIGISIAGAANKNTPDEPTTQTPNEPVKPYVSAAELIPW